jgi:hypothetical protein
MSSTTRVAFAAVAIFLFVTAAIGAVIRGDLVLAAGFSGLVFLTLATIPEPARRARD